MLSFQPALILSSEKDSDIFYVGILLLSFEKDSDIFYLGILLLCRLQNYSSADVRLADVRLALILAVACNFSNL